MNRKDQRYGERRASKVQAIKALTNLLSFENRNQPTEAIMNDEKATKQDFQRHMRHQRMMAEDKRDDAKLAVEAGQTADSVYKMTGQDVIKQFDPKLHALMVKVGESRKAVHDYVMAHTEGLGRKE